MAKRRTNVSILSLVNEANANAQAKGFYSIPRWNGKGEHGPAPASEFNEYRHGITNEQLLHACIELGEAAQIFRKTGEFSDDLLEELADVFIVLADLIGRYDLDERFADMLVAKLNKNKQRPQAYGNAQAQAQQAEPVTVEAEFRFAPDPVPAPVVIDEATQFGPEDMARIREALAGRLSEVTDVPYVSGPPVEFCPGQRDEWCCANHGDCRCDSH